MQVTEKDVPEASNKWWAYQDARMRNIAAKSHYSPQVQLQVDRMMLVLGLCYTGRIYEAYRKRSVSVKVDKPMIRDAKCLREIEAEWAQKGITKTVTPQGILYKLP